MTVTIRTATREDAAIVGELAYLLVREIAPGGAPGIDLGEYRATAARLLDGSVGFWALIAFADADKPVGLLTLSHCAAIYAGGSFGEIAELYVDPDYRSQRIAAKLVAAAIDFAKEQDWPRLEVGAPDLPRWQRTVDFYLKEGFVEVGPRLKRLL